jgi:hypothetical protein
LRETVHSSIGRLCDGLEPTEYRDYDTFDGLNASLLRPLTFENNFLHTVL